MPSCFTGSAGRSVVALPVICCVGILLPGAIAGQAQGAVIPADNLTFNSAFETNEAGWQSYNGSLDTFPDAAVNTGSQIDVIVYRPYDTLVSWGRFVLDAISLTSSEIIWDASADSPGSWDYNHLDPGPEVASTTERSGRPWMTQRVTSLVAEGTHASRFETRGTDLGEYDDPVCKCERAEIAMGNPSRPGYETITADGTIRYYGFMVYVPTSTAYASWQVLFQSKSNAPAGWPETSLIVRENQFQLDNNDEPNTWISTTPIAPATKGVWHRFVIGIKYDPSYSGGFQKVWHAEGQTAPMTLKLDQITHTKEAGKANHVRWGNYHAPLSGTSVIYHDGMRAGTSPQAVAYGPIQ